MPRAVLYADGPGHGWFIMALIFGVVPGLVCLTVKAFLPEGRWAAILTPLSPLIVGPTFGLLWGHREQVALREQGVWTQGVVSDREKVQPRRGEPYYHFRCTFTVEGITYWTSYKAEENYSRVKGDTLDIIYCLDYPKINKIGYLYRQD